MSVDGVPRGNSIEIFNKYNSFIFDADGVLWLGNTVIPGAINLLKILKASNKRIIILTNNSTKSPYDYVNKCKTLGFEGTIKQKVYIKYFIKLFLLKLIYRCYSF